MPGPIQLFKNSLSIVGANFSLFLTILLIPIIVSFFTALFAPNPATGVMVTYESVIYMILMVIYVIISILMSIALILAINNNSLTAKDAYTQAMTYFWKYVGLSILMTIILMVGFLLLIIPGIILSVWFAFATYVLILENGGIVDSLKKSREYVRGKWWGVFGRLIVMSIFIALLAMAISMITVIMPNSSIAEAVVAAFSLFLTPVAVAYMYLLYNEVKSSPTTAPEAPSSFATNTVAE
ncbi:hypothetical protein H6789_01135 [Candidatus Nomurabacteria bacterium]|nr:hypothetical protein [Candidatus Nomurabacteria bacterium]